MLIGLGRNEHGELGNNSNLYIATAIPNIKINSIACGNNHTMIDMDNNIWTFGNNERGQLGLGDNTQRNVPTQVIIWQENIKAQAVSCGGNQTVIIDLNNNVWAFESNFHRRFVQGTYVPTQIFTDDDLPVKAKYVSYSTYYIMIIDLNNEVWKYNKLESQFETALAFQQQHITAKTISCGQNYTMIIDLNNMLWAFGNNKFGSLGIIDLGFWE